MSSELFAADAALVRLLNGFALSSFWSAALSVYLAKRLVWLMSAALLIWAIVVGRRRTDSGRTVAELVVVRAMLAVTFGIFANALFRLLWFRPRPFVAIRGIEHLYGVDPWSQSMPSGHATAAFALAMTVALVDRRAGRFFLVAAALVALGRVLVGVHYPSDIIVGAAVGCGWAYVARAVWPALIPVHKAHP
jgi:membrane-associated phospholipid phosphatase